MSLRRGTDASRCCGSTRCARAAPALSSRRRRARPHTAHRVCQVCIDQRNIDASLRCLPVFLNSCAKLVVLSGPTYTGRLWCVMELFTYVHMGGSKGSVVILEPPGAFATSADFDSFDVHEAECYDPRDKSRMLRIIESAFGGLHNFNVAIHALVSDVTKPAGPIAGPDKA